MYIPDHYDDDNFGGFLMYNPDNVSNTVHPPEVLLLVESGSMRPGASRRIHHIRKRDGGKCSEGKDACLQITRHHDHFYYYCHRCEEKGRIYNKDLSPSVLSETFRIDQKAYIDAEEIKSKVNPEKVKTKTLSVPNDYVNLDSVMIPQEAMSWLNGYGLTRYQMNKNYIGYSPSLERIIFPIYRYIRTPNGEIGGKHLIGWTGRCHRKMSKAARNTAKRPKWLTKKCDPAVLRLYYTAPRAYNYIPSSPTVITEDPVSAIKVNQHFVCDGLAVLGSYIPYSMLTNYRRSPIIIWLDPDKRKEAFKAKIRYRSLGFKTGQVVSDLDPKYYEAEQIRTKIAIALKEAKGGE